MSRAARVLLCDPDHFGTLAAVRDLGRYGLHVTVAEIGGHTSQSGASRFCRERVAAPPPGDAAAFLPWLLRQGEAHPGTLLVPTSDDMAWLMASHHAVLAERFALYQPGVEALHTLLDKSRMYALAGQLGIDTPRTFSPACHESLRAIGRELERLGAYPVIVKPRTQACMRVKRKGEVVHSTPALLDAVDTLRAFTVADPAFLAHASRDIGWPLVQEYRPEARQHTYSLAGFIDAAGDIRAARASAKVFQIPVKVGVGIAFEGRPLRRAQLAAAQTLARAAGYFGLFEVEFIHVADGDRYLLMDFNPRIYGQVQFEVSRGMHLPRLVHEAARGCERTVAGLAETARTRLLGDDAAAERYCDRGRFRTLLWTQRLVGHLSRAEHHRWRRWLEGPRVFDAVEDADDPGPAAAHRRAQARRWLKHPRASLRALTE